MARAVFDASLKNSAHLYLSRGNSKCCTIAVLGTWILSIFVNESSHDTRQSSHGGKNSVRDDSNVSEKVTASSEASSLTLCDNGAEID